MGEGDEASKGSGRRVEPGIRWYIARVGSSGNNRVRLLTVVRHGNSDPLEYECPDVWPGSRCAREEGVGGIDAAPRVDVECAESGELKQRCEVSVAVNFEFVEIRRAGLLAAIEVRVVGGRAFAVDGEMDVVYRGTGRMYTERSTECPKKLGVYDREVASRVGRICHFDPNVLQFWGGNNVEERDDPLKATGDDAQGGQSME